MNKRIIGWSLVGFLTLAIGIAMMSYLYPTSTVPLYDTVTIVVHAPDTPAPPADRLTVGEPGPTDWHGHFANFGFSGRSFQLDPGEVGGGEGDVFDFKDVYGHVWMADLHLFFEGEDYLYVARIDPSAKKGCGTRLPRFSEVPARCIREEKVVISSKAIAWLEKRFGPELFAINRTKLENEYR